MNLATLLQTIEAEGIRDDADELLGEYDEGYCLTHTAATNEPWTRAEIPRPPRVRRQSPPTRPSSTDNPGQPMPVGGP